MLVGASALLIAVLGVLLTPPASGYESSLYAAYHPLVWIGFAVAFTSFLSLILTLQYRIRAIIGLTTLYGVLFLLPVIRGYVLVASPLSDILFHLGIISDIVARGTIPYLFYPGMPVLFSTIQLITGIGDMSLQSVSGIVLTTVLILGSISLVQRFLNRAAWPYALIAALPLMYGTHHISAQPWFFALLLIPLVIYLACWTEEEFRWQQITLIAVLGTALIFYHPLTTIVTITILITITTVQRLSRQQSRRTRISMPLALGAGLTIWLLYLDRFGRLLQQLVVGQIASGGGIAYASQARNTDVTIWRIFEVAITQWGTAFIYTGTGGIIVLVLIVYAWKARLQLRNLEQIAIISYAVGIVFAAIFFAAQIFSRNLLRILQFAVLFSIPLLGIALWRVHVSDRLPIEILKISSEWGRSAILMGLFTCILISGLLGGATLYADDRHLTETTMTGTAWYLDHHDQSQSTYSHRMASNIEIYYHGYTEDQSTQRVFIRGDPDLQLLPRLGYDEHETVGEWIDSGYLLTTHANIEQGHYTVQDETRLATDPAADRIYANGEYRIWKTNSGVEE